MAVHAGPAEQRRDDFYGPTVNRAARLRAAGYGGQILVSDDVQRATSAALPDGAWFVDLGVHRMKDLTRPERIWQLGHGELANDFPPIKTLDARGHNLPVQLTAFVGRDIEVRDVRKRLESASLVTLTGPGGIGKTRLALQVAAERIDEHADGVWFADLSSVTDPELVPSRVAAALGIREQPGRALLDTLSAEITTKNALIVLDNCEQVIDGCATTADVLLKSAPGLRIVATSREPLGVYGEALYDVRPLEVPQADSIFADEALASEAVRLFVDRAALVDNEFAPSDDIGSLVSICRTLEGIPLAIELAAALIRTTPTNEIAERMADRLTALTHGPRTVPERQRTLRAAIDWSYELLADDERTLFERLSVFSGGATATAAATVTGAPPLSEHQIEPLLERLVQRSLVAATDGNERRYRMLDTIRAYAAEKLVERGETNEIRDRHAAWAAALSAELAQKLNGPEGAVAGRIYDVEQDNARAAATHAIESGDEPTAATLVSSMFHLWIIRGQFAEGRARCDQFVAAFPDSAYRGRALAHGGQLAAAQGDMAAAIPALEEALALARESRDRDTVMVSLNQLAAAGLQTGRLEDAKTYASEALTLARVVQRSVAIAQSLNILGVAAAIQGDEQAAYNYYEDALGISREVGIRENIARLLMNLGNISLGRRDYDRARRYYDECRETALEIGDAVGASAALSNLGAVAKSVGDLESARRYLEQALEEKTRIGDGRGLSIALHGIGEVERLDGHFPEAREAVARCIELCREQAFTLGLVQGLESVATIATDAARPSKDAVRIAAAAEEIRETTGIRRNDEDTAEFDSSMAFLRAAIGDQAFDAAWADGRQLSQDDAAADAVAFLRS
jgi:predicted ATPase